MKKIFLIGTLCLFFNTFAQENNFGTFELKKSFIDSEKWNIITTAHYKQSYFNDEWRRVGVDVYSKRKLNHWSAYGGLVTNFTFDETITNYWEIRPWIGLGLTSPIIDKLSLNQTFKFEWRNLLFRDILPNKITTRTRYKIKTTYAISNIWNIFTAYEWYYVPNKELGNRFISSTEWSMGTSKKFSKFTLYFNYKRIRFFNTLLNKKNYGNSFVFTFLFK